MLKFLGILVVVARCGLAVDEAAGCVGKCPAIENPLQATLLIHNDCTKYCLCKGGRAAVQDCPKGLQFSDEIAQCISPKDAKCEVIGPHHCIGTCPAYQDRDKAILLVHEECKKYCLCNNSYPIVLDCPGDLHFSYADEKCVEPKKAECHGIGGITEKPCIDVEGCLGKCPAYQDPNEIILFVHEDCRKYCRCKYGYPIIRVCPGDWHFSEENERCMKPEEAKCDGITKPSTRPPTTTPPTRPPPTRPPPTRPPPTRPPPTRPPPTRPPPTRPPPTRPPPTRPPPTRPPPTRPPPTRPPPTRPPPTRPPPTRPPPIDAEGCIGICPIHNSLNFTVHLPHEECTKFCKCNWGKPYVFTCPENLHFNPTEYVCDFPIRANCTGIGSITGNKLEQRIFTIECLRINNGNCISNLNDKSDAQKEDDSINNSLL